MRTGRKQRGYGRAYRRGWRGWRTLAGIAATSTLVFSAAGWAGAGAAGAASRFKGKPVVIGVSASLSGTFAANGLQLLHSDELWVKQTNAQGGLLGRKVVLKYVNDNSSPTQVVTNYEDLITVDHVTLTLAPFSSLLTHSAGAVAARYGYSLIGGANGAPSVFLHEHNIFDTSPDTADTFVSLAKYLAALPASKRPKSAAYVTSNGIFTEPTIPPARAIMSKAGIKTAYTDVFPSETTDLNPIADAIAATKATVVLYGQTTDAHLIEMLQRFKVDGYNPKLISATSGVFGTAVPKAMGAATMEGLMQGNDWYPGLKNKQSEAFVKAYSKQYSIAPANIAGTNAETYSACQVLADAVKATHSTTDKKVTAYLHKGKLLQTVLGPVKFNKIGQNVALQFTQFQWQTTGTAVVPVVPTNYPGAKKILYPKPAWH